MIKDSHNILTGKKIKFINLLENQKKVQMFTKLTYIGALFIKMENSYQHLIQRLKIMRIIKVYLVSTGNFKSIQVMTITLSELRII